MTREHGGAADPFGDTIVPLNEALRIMLKWLEFEAADPSVDCSDL
jgi:hypothetical protein